MKTEEIKKLKEDILKVKELLEKRTTKREAQFSKGYLEGYIDALERVSEEVK